MASKTGHVFFHLLLTVLHGIDQDVARKPVKGIKATKLKVQGSIQGDQAHASGNNRGDLQHIISKLDDFNLQLPLQTINFRD